MTETDKLSVEASARAGKEPASRAQGPGRAAGLAWLATAIGLGVGFSVTFREMWLRWFPVWNEAKLGLYERLTEGESYYTHGPLIPLVSFFTVLLLVRHTKIPYRPRPVLGALVTGTFLTLHLMSSLARVMFVSGFAFIGVLAGLVVVFWGLGALRRLWFPLAFLMFMVPLPEVAIHRLNFRLKMVATWVGVELANVVGIIAERNGNRVFLEGDKQLVVANVCNGLRTLISLLAFGALYAYVCRLRGLWRVGLFAMSVPVALVSNALRIVALIAVAHWGSVELATGWFHDTSGVLIFVVAFLLMFGLERIVLGVRAAIGWPAKVLPLGAGVKRGPEDEGQWSRLAGAPGAARGWAMVALVGISAPLALYYHRGSPSRTTSATLAEVLPSDVETSAGRWEWDGREYELDAQTLRILEYPAYGAKRYVGADGWVIASLIFSRDNRKGTHPPDVCLEGGGGEILAQKQVPLSGVPGRGTVGCREIVVQNGARRTYHLYTYKCGTSYTPSFFWQQLMIFVNGLTGRDAGGALVQVQTHVDDSTGDARSRALGMMRQLVAVLDRDL
jgi:EpsI family protein